jgi:hypothetical protein
MRAEPTTLDNTSSDIRRITHEIDALFCRVFRIFQAQWPEFFLVTDHTNSIKDVIEQTNDSPQRAINRRKDALEFNRAFFFRNLYKNLFNISQVISRSMVHRIPSNILDLGSGAGVATIAWYAVVRPQNSRVVLFDENADQLILARRALGVAGISPFMTLQSSYPNRNETLPNGLRLISYWLCEQDRSKLDPEDLVQILHGGAIITDYRQVIEDVLDRLPAKADAISWSVRLHPADCVCTVLKQKQVEANGAYIRF